MTPKAFENWSGAVRCYPDKFAEPQDLDELRRVVRHESANGRGLRVVGSGHSFTPLVETGGLLLSLDGLQGLVDADREKGEATVWAGTKLWRLNQILDELGLAMENLGDINKQSIAGALGTGTHGTGKEFGNLATQVVGLTLVAASGDIVECSAEDNADLFNAARISLGTLGVIAKVRLRVVPAYRLRYVRERTAFADVLESAWQHRAGNRQFEFYFFPYAEPVQLKLLNQTDAPANVNKPLKWVNDFLLENAAFGVMSRICRAIPSLCPTMARIGAGALATGDVVDVGHRALSTMRLVRFHEMEYAVPAEHGTACAAELKDWIESERIPVHFPIEFRYIQGDPIWLSPNYQRDSAAISVHMYKGMPYERYFEGAEAIFRRYQGRPHWGKMHSLTANDLAPLYPKWDAFQHLRDEMDPDGLFLNDYLRGLFGVES